MRYGKQPLFSAQKIFTIGDIHGNLSHLENLWELIKVDFNPDTDIVVFLGDLTDRGPQGPQVIEFVLKLKQTYHKSIWVIEGNHEWMLKAYLSQNNPHWLIRQFPETLEQFKAYFQIEYISPVVLQRKMEESGLIQVYNELIPYFETVDLLCTHAPLSPQMCRMHGLEKYAKFCEENPDHDHYFLERMLYELRWNFVNENEPIPSFTKFRICGHQFAHHKQPRLFKNRAYIDTGCGPEPKRPLTAFCYPNKKVYKVPVK